MAIFQVYISNALKNQLTLKKTATSQTHFGFTNISSEMHIFKATVIWNKKFRFGSPCSWFRFTYGYVFTDLEFVKHYCMIIISCVHHQIAAHIELNRRWWGWRYDQRCFGWRTVCHRFSKIVRFSFQRLVTMPWRRAANQTSLFLDQKKNFDQSRFIKRRFAKSTSILDFS